MAIDLKIPLEWTKATPEQQAMLADLQGNILDGHGRKSTRHLIVAFDDAKAGRAFMKAVAPLVTSAGQQLEDARRFRETGVSGPAFLGVLLTREGYKALGIEDARVPLDKGPFDAGMLARASVLNDPPAKDMEKPYQAKLHAMILIGGNPNSRTSWLSQEATDLERKLLALTGPQVRVVTTETGRAIMRDNGTDSVGTHKIEGIEHFGYVDGRSQPLMLKELIDREAIESDGISVWNPTFGIGQVLVPDPGAPAPAKATAFGSYFVFRKLEQNVDLFKRQVEEELGDNVGLGDLAGAMMVGRFEDGTPVVLQRDDGGDDPVMNNFDYKADDTGVRCPFHAHIRKTNPRGEVPGDRDHIMARRGMTYGRRNRITDPDDRPTKDVGLMFMAFHRSIAEGFEFTQAMWANNGDFARQGTGRDPIIGQRGVMTGYIYSS